MPHGETLDVQLVNDRVGEAVTGPGIVLPAECLVGYYEASGPNVRAPLSARA